MTPAERQKRKRRLERAGFAALPVGWVPVALAQRVAAQVDAYRDDVERVVADAEDLPRGRPPKA